MKKLIRTILVVASLFALTIVGWVLYSRNTIKLAVPINPPKFSVGYYYSWQSTSIVAQTNIDQEIVHDIQEIQKAGFTGIKINFSFRQNNSTANSIAVTAAKNGLYPIGQLIGHTAKPATRAFTADELTEWENFVRAEVRNNKDRIYFWEVWNEPSMIELFRYGTPAEYLELLKRSQQIIKQENPAAKIIVTADYTDTTAEEFTNEYLSLGGAAYFDYLSFHPYNALDPNSRYTLAETLAQEKALATKYNRPLWISEIGSPDSGSNEAGQAAKALTVFRAAQENNIPIVWFHWSDRRLLSVDGQTGWGLVRPDNSFKPAYETIRSFIAQVDNAP